MGSARMIPIILGLVCFSWVLCTQVHSQSSTATQDQTLSNDQEIYSGNQTITFPSSNAVRSFSMPGESPISFVPSPSHFAPPVTDGNFGSLSVLLGYKNKFNLVEAEALLKEHGDIRIITNCYIPEKQRKPTTHLQIVVIDSKDMPSFKEQYEPIGIGNYKALDSDSISEQVLGIAIREALKIGADVMTFQEGAALKQVARGHSFGLFNSFSFVNSPNSTDGMGNVAVGGLGFGKGKIAYHSEPWLRVMFFRKIKTASDNKSKEGALPAVNTNGTKTSEFEDSLKKYKSPTPEEAYIETKPHISNPDK